MNNMRHSIFKDDVVGREFIHSVKARYKIDKYPRKHLHMIRITSPCLSSNVVSRRQFFSLKEMADALNLFIKYFN